MRWLLLVALTLSLRMLPAGAQASEPSPNQIVTTGNGRIEVSSDRP